MLLFISDANILMDVEVGELIAPMFRLGYQYAVPDILYYEELEEHHAYLLDMGLQLRSLNPERVKRVQTLSKTYIQPSRNDLFALALAESEKCTLLTGDAALRKAAESEKVKVSGSIWLIEQMLRKECISVVEAKAALTKMHLNGRRLPWNIAEKMILNFAAGKL